MQYFSIICRAIILIIAVLVSACSSTEKFYRKTGFLVWDTFADQLGTGSSTTQSNSILTSEGDAEITLIKAEHSAQDSANAEYPYSGVFFGFDKSRKPVDKSNYKKILLTYRLTGQLSLVLAQKDLPTGEEYRVELPPHDSYTQEVFRWNDFAQPEWVENPQPLDLKRISGVKFKITAREKTTSILSIRSFELQ